MERLPWILGFCALGSLGGVLGASAVLLLPESVRRRLVPVLVSYATGTLLGAAFLGLLPEALEGSAPRTALATALAGLLLFFVLEQWVLWRHCHDEACEQHARAAPLILVGDALHNFVDGVVIGGAFLVSVPLGVTTALAVLAHEVPQEVGDFALLLDAGYGRARALAWNALSSSTTLVGGLLAWAALPHAQAVTPVLLALAAGGFIYIAAADLMPALHRRADWRAAVTQTVVVLAGVATVAVMRHGHG
jgi:zinc and cadmium transporter